MAALSLNSATPPLKRLVNQVLKVTLVAQLAVPSDARMRPETPLGRAALPPSRWPDRAHHIETSAPVPRRRCEDVQRARAVVLRARRHLPRRPGCRVRCNTPQHLRAGPLEGRRGSASRRGSPARYSSSASVAASAAGGVATVETVQHGPPGEGEEDHRRVAQPAGKVERSVVGDLGTRRVAVLEQRPTEPGQQ